MVKIPTGILAGEELKELNDTDLRGLAQSPVATDLVRASFYKGNLSGNQTGVTFFGISFKDCNFARSIFERVNFSRCRFTRVDLTRSVFKDCFFSDTTFVSCDPYYASFEQTEIDPAAFKNCFRAHSEWNKALILFSNLRKSLKDMGESRFSRAAEYYFRVWQRRRLFHRWRFKRISGFGTWFGSLCLGGLTGYGERPVYLAGWAFLIITILSGVYMKWLPSAVDGVDHRFRDYWYHSFRVFFAQGLTNGFQSIPLCCVQVFEFLSGLVMVSLLIGSIARKLSP